MLASSARLGAARPGLAGGSHAAHARAVRPRGRGPAAVTVRCLREHGDQEATGREKAAVLVTGVATAAYMALSAGSAEAADLLAVQGRQAELALTLDESKELGKKLSSALDESSSAAGAAAQGGSELEQANAEIQSILAIVSEVETSVRHLEEQRQLLAADKAAIQAELEEQRQLLAAAQATASAQAGAAAEKAVQGTLASKYALQGTVGLVTAWGLSSQLALNKLRRQQAGAQVVQSGELEEEVKSARELAASARREMADLQAELQELQMKVEESSQALGYEQAARQQAREEAQQLRQELSSTQSELRRYTGLNAELRQSLKDLEARFSRTIYAAESEATELKRQLDELADAQSSSPALQPWQARGFPAPLPKEVRVQFSLRRELQMGQTLVLAGSHPSLGGWDMRSGLQLEWTDGHVWQAELALPPGTTAEFKCVVVSEKEGWARWEEGANHVLHVPTNGTAAMGVKLEWGLGESVTTRRSGAGVPDLARLHAARAGGNGGGERGLAMAGAGANGNGNGNGKVKQLA